MIEPAAAELTLDGLDKAVQRLMKRH